MKDLYLDHETGITVNFLMPVNTEGKAFEWLMSIYQKASDQVYEQLNVIKEKACNLYGFDIISTITRRIKTPTSIINKMKKKNFDINYKNLIDYVDDVAGIRVVCPTKDNIYTIIDIIDELPNINVVQVKDYIKNKKKSGYSGYHIIVETLVEIEDKAFLTKVEIQIRTMAMDFWATNEHKIKYKTNKDLRFIDSKRMVLYAKILNFIDEKINKIYKKQELSNKVWWVALSGIVLHVMYLVILLNRYNFRTKLK